MKILYVVTEDWYFYSHRLPLALEAIRRGNEVVLVTRISKFENLVIPKGINIVNLRFLRRSSLNPALELIALFEIICVFLKERPNLVHLVALKPVIYGLLAAKLLGVPARVSALGGLGFVFSSERLLARLLRSFLQLMFRFLFNDPRSILILQNQDDLHLLEKSAGIDSSRIRLIRGAGVDLYDYAYFDLPTGTPVVMLASRMLWDKGVGEFVQAANIIKEKGIAARFVLVGEPDTENPSAVSIKQLNEWHKTGIVEWWGYCTEMPKILSQSTIVCLPSYYGEGLPKVLIEAMSCGRPIVTTEMPGCKELVVGQKNGFLVNPRDSVALAESLSILVLDRLLCQQMGKEGRLIVEKEFSLKRVTNETLAVYDELLKI